MLHLLGHPDSDAAQALAHGLEERVAEGVHADREDTADAVDLDQVALDTRHHGPDVQEGQDGKENSPDQRQGDAHQCCQQAVAPVLGDSEGCEAGFPHTVEAVGPRGFCNHIFKFNLDNVVVYVFGIPVDQVDLFGVDILHRFLVQTVVVHVFVVGFIYVPLFSDKRRMQKLLFCLAVLQSSCHAVLTFGDISTLKQTKKKDNIGSREGGVDANWEDGVFLSESCIVKLFLPFLLDVTKIQWTSAYGETSSVSSDTTERSWGVTSEQTGEPPWNLLGWRRD